MVRARLTIGLAIAAALSSTALAAENNRRLEYAPAPADNPLKGLVPYARDVRRLFPCSMEFNYLPYSALVHGYDDHDWQPLEKMLDDIASRGHHAVFRIFLEYPGKTGVIPRFLIDDGLKVTSWLHPDSPASRVETPDYANPRLRKSLVQFIAALGKKYDGDPRIGFITAGLLGVWGEWHTYPRSELFARKDIQRAVMDAYENAFKITPVLLRYPAGDHDDAFASNAARRLGYHDDSFAWATLETGKKEDAWFYMSLLRAAGPGAMAKWKTSPIGGEIRPEAWGKVFDDPPGAGEIQDFRRCVEATHVTWLMDSGMFDRPSSPTRKQRALAEVRRMGYEFHVSSVTIHDAVDGKFKVRLELENRGVAPFYYDWKPQWCLIRDGRAILEYSCRGRLTGLLPGDPPRIWSEDLPVAGVEPGVYTLALRVPSPLRGGAPLRFANKSQDANVNGWLTLGTVRLH